MRDGTRSVWLASAVLCVVPTTAVNNGARHRHAASANGAQSLPFPCLFFSLFFCAGVGNTPAMGWNSWNAFRCNINEALVQEVARAIVDSGLRDAGYQVRARRTFFV